MSLTRYLIILLMCSMDGTSTVDPADYIPTDVNCEVVDHITGSPQDSNAVKMRVSWNIASNIISDVRRYVVSCRCTVSGHHIEHKVNSCNPPCSHQITFSNASCYDKCHCRVHSVIRQSLDNQYMNWSNVSTCHIGPTVAPKAPPVITSSPVRTDNHNSSKITFKLPAENLHCDSTETISNITVNVTDPVTGSHQYICDHPRPLHNDERSYTCIFQVEPYQFWRPFTVAVAVNNSIGPSPYSDHMIATGASNGDITRSDYELEFYYDWSPVESMLYFHWQLSEKAEHMMFSQFIIGFHVAIEMLQPDYHSNLTTHSMETKNSSFNVTMESTSLAVRNITLEPNQRYLLIGRILTEDNDTWGPEAVYKYFEIHVAGSTENSSSDHSKSLLIILSCFILLLTVLVVALLLYIARVHTVIGRLCHDIHSDNNNGDDNCTDKMNEVIGRVTESYTDYPCDTSYVENISSGDIYSRKKDENTSSDDLNSTTDDNNSQIYRTTSV